MVETFTAEVVVTSRQQNYEVELERLASAWFESKVSCIALDISMTSETGRFVARGTFVPQPLPPRSRTELAARWLGLLPRPVQAPFRPR